MPRLKSCSACGRVHLKGQCAKCGRTYNRAESEQGRHTHAWNKKSIDIKERSQYLCAICRDNNIFTHDGLETHHIIKLRDRPDLLLEDGNLICLCGVCHERADKGAYSVEYLRGLADKRDKQTP